MIATGRPVLYLGGFDGQDNVETAASLSKMVADGELRYIYYGGGTGRGQGSSIGQWITSSCRVVPGFDTETENSGAPGGTTLGSTSGGGFFGRGFGGAMQISLYDCAG